MGESNTVVSADTHYIGTYNSIALTNRYVNKPGVEDVWTNKFHFISEPMNPAIECSYNKEITD